MSKQDFYQILQSEVARIDEAKTSKRNERIIEGFTTDPAPQAKIAGKNYRIFNSNDYLGLRFHPRLRAAEHEASETYGSGPGAVRFISGSLMVHRDLEKAIAAFHGRDDAMVVSSAFATNLAVISSLSAPQAKDSKVAANAVIISDELNHRSIIDGVRITNLPKEQRQIFKHMDMADLTRVLESNLGTFDRALIVTDGIFSMLGEYQDLKAMRAVIDQYDSKYPQGVLLIVDDAHGVGAFGATGRGTEEVTGARADVLIGTFGKAFGADGGYVVADQAVIDYLREAAATYIYSNSVSPGTAGAALAAVTLLDEPEGRELLARSTQNVARFKQLLGEAGFVFAADSIHPIQPLLIGDAAKAKTLALALYQAGILVTTISYPVVPPGRDEIRAQVSAAHTAEDLEYFVQAATTAWKQME